jgi:hypothetical protein
VLELAFELSVEPVLPLMEPAPEFFCESIEPLCEWLDEGVCESCIEVDDELPDIEPFCCWSLFFCWSLLWLLLDCAMASPAPSRTTEAV